MNGSTRYAARSATGRWHVVIDGRPVCSSTLPVEEDTMVTVGRAPARPRCHRRACWTRWVRQGVSDTTRAREAMQREQATWGLRESRWTRETENRAMWARLGWLDPHVVYITHHKRLRVYRVAFASERTFGKTARRLARDRAHLIDQITVENRHAAILTKLAVLDSVAEHRRELLPGALPTGGTDVWRHTAPTINLADLAARETDLY